jgi:hypothetical protein
MTYFIKRRKNPVTVFRAPSLAQVSGVRERDVKNSSAPSRGGGDDKSVFVQAK